MKDLLLLSLCALVVTTLSATAQSDSLRPRFGCYADVGLNMHTADFRELPGISNGSPGFRFGMGFALGGGLLYEYPIDKQISVILRAGYVSRSALLERDEAQVVAFNGEAVPITIEHRMDATLNSMSLTPMVGKRFSGKWLVMAGGSIGYVATHRYSQQERISDNDTRGTFENGRRVRNESFGNIPQALALDAALVVGTSYDLPMNAQGTLLASPEAMLTVGLTPVVSGLSWNTHAVHLGVALKYSPIPRIVIPPPLPPPPPAPPALMATVVAHGIGTDGTEQSVARMQVEELVATNMRPLLNYVFFDQNSSTIPERYNRLAPHQVEVFNLDSLHSNGAIAVYHQLLNIVGLRLRQNPSATVRLVGTNDGQGSELGNRVLSRQRAESVRNYLRDVWDIAEKRMVIEAVDLPSVPSNSARPEGVEENRRVEILATDPAILKPVQTADVMRTSIPSTIRFHIAHQAEAGIRSWHLTASQDGRVLKDFTGTSTLPEVLEWQVDTARGITPTVPGVIHYQLTVADAAGQQVQTTDETLALEQELIRKNQFEQIGNVVIERYNLILFDYDRADLNAEHRRLIEEIRRRISTTSRVKITGYADLTGDVAYNQRLSLERARSAAKALNLKPEQVQIIGETLPLYDNTLPDGRFNSRVVTVEIATPE